MQCLIQENPYLPVNSNTFHACNFIFNDNHKNLNMGVLISVKGYHAWFWGELSL